MALVYLRQMSPSHFAHFHLGRIPQLSLTHRVHFRTDMLSQAWERKNGNLCDHTFFSDWQNRTTVFFFSKNIQNQQKNVVLLIYSFGFGNQNKNKRTSKESAVHQRNRTLWSPGRGGGVLAWRVVQTMVGSTTTTRARFHKKQGPGLLQTKSRRK